MSLVQQVRRNLIHYNQWTNLQEIKCPDLKVFLSGTPAVSLHPVSCIASGDELIYPIEIEEKLTMDQVSKLFETAQVAISERPKRITLAIVGADGTIVYYFVHDGLVKPKKN